MHGIRAVLTGGACAGIYSGGSYSSRDVDFVLEGRVELPELDAAMASLGFARQGDRYVHPSRPSGSGFPGGPWASVRISRFGRYPCGRDGRRWRSRRRTPVAIDWRPSFTGPTARASPSPSRSRIATRSISHGSGAGARPRGTPRASRSSSGSSSAGNEGTEVDRRQRCRSTEPRDRPIEIGEGGATHSELEHPRRFEDPGFPASGRRGAEASGLTSISKRGLPPDFRTPRWLTLLLSAK